MWPFYYGHHSHFGHEDQYIITTIGVIRSNAATRPTREIGSLRTFEAFQTLMSVTANVAIKAVMEIAAIMTISITALIIDICNIV